MGRQSKRRRYSDEQRAAALAVLAANAGNLGRTARQLDIPANTLKHWSVGSRHPEAAEMGEAKKASLADLFDGMAYKLLGVAERKADALNAKDAMVAAGIAVDKARLLRGEPTQIDETRDDTRLAAFRARYGAAHAPGDPGADAGGQPVHPPPADAAPDPVPGARVS